MFSSSPNSTGVGQRRKKKNSKTKVNNERDQHTNSANDVVVNERLQPDRESNKHHDDNTQPPVTTATIAALNIIQTSAHSLCNGKLLTPIIDCCRDANCVLNTIDVTSEAKTNATELSSSTSTSSSRSLHTPTNDDRERSTSREKSSESKQLGNKKNSDTSHIAQTKIPSLENPQTSSTLDNEDQSYMLQIHLDLFAWVLFILAFVTRFYRLSYPRNVVFDELHYGKSVAHYMRNQFFFDTHPPLGKQLIAAVADSVGYDGNYTASHVGSPYESTFPVFWMRLIPALCGSLLPSAVYSLLKEMSISRRSSFLGGLLVVFDNALLIQSRLILMESMLLLFCTAGLYFLLRLHRSKFLHISWFLNGFASAALLTFAFSVKYVGFFTYFLAIYLILKYLWDLLYDGTKTDLHIVLQTIAQFILFSVVPIFIYLGVFYLHLNTLYKAGPHDVVLTSAFQASLEGGLASITRNQPLKVAHGSQITLRHTHGHMCWLHSHAHVYPIRYPDGRGSSHQQQVTCYPFKDVNNWWIVKKPKYDDIVVGENPEYIRDGDIIQLVHGITSRALNTHDVAAPLTPSCQEVSCYIDYGINMKSELLWKVDIINKEKEGPIWKTIKSEVRFIHVSTGAALKYSNRMLPEWGFRQHEIVSDRETGGKDVIWNVEEHRYTKDSDRTERERTMLNAEMIPTGPTKLSFMQKFLELQFKMFSISGQVQSHMYSSSPLDWPLLTRGIAYWVSSNSNAQIHLLGNILIWYTSTLSLLVYFALFIFYLLRRRRLCFDIDEKEWKRFSNVGHTFFVGYLLHYIPYFFTDSDLFLHHYMPAFLYKVQLFSFVIDHIDYLIRRFFSSRLWLIRAYRLAILTWFLAVVGVYIYFLPISYGMKKLNVQDILSLRWKDTWDFVVHRSVETRAVS
ncbi:protein O-mannosyltransferase rt [Haematobia irritans]|uniref:protein O-mannosyltransferase rt n=1 Tax=Haematobia irritans TaxID=7368 RepID=UPI003F503D3E